MYFPPKVLAPELDIPLDDGQLALRGRLDIPEGAVGLVVLVHGSGSSRHSVRNQHVARALRTAGMGTLLFDLVSETENLTDTFRAPHHYDVEWMAGRLRKVTAWLGDRAEVADLPFGYFGAGTGAAAALIAAAQEDVRAVVSRGGRPDLALEVLPQVHAATLLIVGDDTPEIVRLNWLAFERLTGRKRVEIVAGAGLLFEEPGKLGEVAQLTRSWFLEAFTGGVTSY